MPFKQKKNEKVTHEQRKKKPQANAKSIKSVRLNMQLQMIIN